MKVGKYTITRDEHKNELIKKRPGDKAIGFEQVVDALIEGNILDIIEHENPQKYPNQKIMILEINNYAYKVPYSNIEKHIKLITAYPCRKSTKLYL